MIEMTVNVYALNTDGVIMYRYSSKLKAVSYNRQLCVVGFNEVLQQL